MAALPIVLLLRRLRKVDCLSPGVQGQPGQQREIPSLFKKKKKKKKARCQWLTPVILATQEAEIRRIAA
jgi:hypothetical protein